MICDPVPGVTSGRIASYMALGWGGEGLLVTTKLPSASKCLSNPSRRLVLSKCSREAGWRQVHRFGLAAQEKDPPNRQHLTFDLSHPVSAASMHFLLNPQPRCLPRVAAHQLTPSPASATQVPQAIRHILSSKSSPEHDFHYLPYSDISPPHVEVVSSEV